MSTGLTVTTVSILILGIIGAVCGLTPYNPYWLSAAGFWVFTASMLVLTVLAILRQNGIIK